VTAGLALVTGAGRGPGRAVALALGAAGARVVAIDVNPDAAQRTAAAIAASTSAASSDARPGPHPLAQAVDVSNKMAVQTLLYTLLEAGERLAVLVNAAHIAPTSPALKMDEWEWDRTLDVNLKGTFLMSQTVARAMKETGGGLILNLLRPSDSPHAAVRAARAGLVGLTEALAAEWRPYGVTVELLESVDPMGVQTGAAVAQRCQAALSAA
jgi:NAD(P)-dependent dehydrogenase (short-subunit alcohol dehydrogenase family)